MIEDSGFQTAFFYFGLGQGIIIVILAFFLFAPKAGQVPRSSQNANVIQTRRNYAPTEVIRQPIFWLMYFMFVIVGAGGLMVTANLKPIAADWKIDNVPVTLMAMTMTAVTFAATIDRVLNGLTRPFFGWISDMIGRENTMFIAFGMEGVGIWALYMWGHDPLWFVLLSGFVFFAWGEIYSLFPSTCTDTFGSKFADHQCRPALHRKGHGGTAGAGRELHAAVSGTWDSVFLIAAGANILASLLAIAVLKPWRKVVVSKAHASYKAPKLNANARRPRPGAFCVSGTGRHTCGDLAARMTAQRRNRAPGVNGAQRTVRLASWNINIPASCAATLAAISHNLQRQSSRGEEAHIGRLR